MATACHVVQYLRNKSQDSRFRRRMDVQRHKVRAASTFRPACGVEDHTPALHPSLTREVVAIIPITNMPSFLGVVYAVVASLAVLHGVQAGYNPSSTSNVVTYWGKPLLKIRWAPLSKISTGQNSYGQGTGSLAQQRLSYYCASE